MDSFVSLAVCKALKTEYSDRNLLAKRRYPHEDPDPDSPEEDPDPDRLLKVSVSLRRDLPIAHGDQYGWGRVIQQTTQVQHKVQYLRSVGCMKAPCLDEEHCDRGKELWTHYSH